MGDWVIGGPARHEKPCRIVVAMEGSGKHPGRGAIIPSYPIRGGK